MQNENWVLGTDSGFQMVTTGCHGAAPFDAFSVGTQARRKRISGRPTLNVSSENGFVAN